VQHTTAVDMAGVMRCFYPEHPALLGILVPMTTHKHYWKR